MKKPPNSEFRLTPPKLKISENDVESGCLDLARVRGYWPARLHAGTFKSVDGRRWIKGVAKGTPDWALLHECFPGFLLETKRPGADLSDDQKLKIVEIQMGYHLAIAVVDSVDALAAWLDRHELEAGKKERGAAEQPHPHFLTETKSQSEPKP